MSRERHRINWQRGECLNPLPDWAESNAEAKRRMDMARWIDRQSRKDFEPRKRGVNWTLILILTSSWAIAGGAVAWVMG